MNFNGVVQSEKFCDKAYSEQNIEPTLAEIKILRQESDETDREYPNYEPKRKLNVVSNKTKLFKQH